MSQDGLDPVLHAPARLRLMVTLAAASPAKAASAVSPNERLDVNGQLADWLTRANARQHRGLGCRPADRWDADRAAMLDLPPAARPLQRRCLVAGAARLRCDGRGTQALMKLSRSVLKVSL